MQHTATEPAMLIAEVLLGFEEVYQKPYIAKEYLDEIRQADLLLIPSEQIREGLAPVFPELTSEFFRYLKTHAGKTLKTDIAVSDENYLRLSLHTPMVPLATMVVTETALPETAKLVTGYLKQLAGECHRQEEELDTIVNIIVDDRSEKPIRKIMYRGKISAIEKSLADAVKAIQGEKE